MKRYGLKELPKTVDFFIRKKQTFTISSAQYSATINHAENKYFYSNETRSFSTFHCANALKKELHPKKNIFANVKKHELDYYLLNPEFSESSTVFNVDIKSAYLNAIKPHISKELYARINLLKKIDRLVCIGMLAYRPIIFNYEQGILMSYTPKENEFENCFFYCVEIISKVMRELSLICGKNFIFVWVDGIYFLPCEKTKENVFKYLTELNYSYSFDVLTDFNCEYTERGIFFNYIKESEKKRVFVPNTDKKKQYEENKYLKNFVLSEDLNEKRINLIKYIKTKNNLCSK